MTRFQFPVRNLPLPIQEIATEMEHLVDRMFTKPQCGSNSATHEAVSYAPAMDVTESDMQYTIEIDLPGVKSSDVKLEIHEDKLSIAGSRVAAEPAEGSQRHREERSFGEFRRTLVLPKQIDADKVDAQFQDGVLTVVVPKVPKVQPKTIEIRTA
jgi:HSP20 family protein